MSERLRIRSTSALVISAMSEPRLLKPSLYRREGTDMVPDHPALLGSRCECGYVHFPPQTYGCEQCGRYGASLHESALSGRGQVLSVATVHIHQAKADPDVMPLEAPFTLATVQLDDGPRIRGLLTDDCTDAVPGMSVCTTLVDVGRDGHTVLDLRFARAESHS